MKKVFCPALLAAALLFSCNDNTSSTESSTTTDSSTMMSDQKDNTATRMDADSSRNSNMQTGKPITDKDIVDFVRKASAGSMMEVELGQYAAQNAQSQRVKDFGNMMVADHSKANNDLKNMAMSNNIEVPAAMPADMKSHVDMMKKMTGAAFDKAYMDMMVNDHKKDISEFKKASADLKEDSYKAFATMTLPVLQKHLDSAQAIHKNK